MTPEEAFAKAGDTIARSWRAEPGATPPAEPSGPERGVSPRESAAELQASQAATTLARKLARFPGIDHYRGVVLGSLVTAGPRPLQAIWKVARETVGEGIDALTIGELLDRFGPPPKKG